MTLHLNKTPRLKSFNSAAVYDIQTQMHYLALRLYSLSTSELGSPVLPLTGVKSSLF